MEYHGVQTASRAPGPLHYDSDRSVTLDSLKDLMAFSQRPSRARHDDILFAAKHARAQMPPQFREPPSSTGSHGTITTSSIHLGGLNGHHRNGHSGDLTSDSAPSSTFSAGPDAESTRASVHYQRGSHRVHKSTGRFGSNARAEEKKDILSGIVNTSALFRTFKEWRPEDATDTGIFEDADAYADAHNDGDAESTTNFGVLGSLDQFDQENCGPIPSSPPAPVAAKRHPKSGGPLADAPARRNRAVLQATVQNESDLSSVLPAPAQKQAPRRSAPSKPSSLRHASAAPAALAPAPVLKKSATVGTIRDAASKRTQQAAAAGHSPPLDEISSPETSAGSREDIDLGVRTVAAPAAAPAPSLKRTGLASAAPVSRVTSMAGAIGNDGVTNQSFIVPAKAFPLLHNLATGTLRFTPGTYVYGAAADAQRKHQLPAGRVPEDEKEIFVDIETIRDEVIRLQEHDEMLQNEIIQGEIKYKSLLDRFYSLAHKTSDDEFVSNLDQPYKESQEQNQLLKTRIRELENALDAVHTGYEEHVQSSADLAAERDAAISRANAATDKSKRLASDLETVRERLAASSQRPSQEAQRRIQQLEKMVAERERVIKALRDERDAARSSHREECKLYKERIARMEAEKSMLSGDHAKCNDEKHALTAAKDALAQKNSGLKEKVHAVRQQCRDREEVVHAIVDRQRTQISKLQVLLREKEKSVLQLDENFRKLRESWSAKDETLVRMTAMLDQLPDQLPQGHRGTLHATDSTRDLDANTRDLQFEGGGPARAQHEHHGHHDHHEQHEQRELQHNEHKQNDEHDESVDEGGSDSGQSAMDYSLDENMTSAFIVPDLDFQTEDVDGEGSREAGEGAMDEQELADELAQVRDAAAAAKARTSSKSAAKTTLQKTVSFQTNGTAAHHNHTHATTTSSATAVCKHNRVGCVVCRQMAGHSGENEKITVAVPRPILERPAHSQPVLPDPAMDPGSALAYVMKLLDDERRHLWMQIQTMRKTGAAEEALNEKRRPRRALREAEELWNAYVLKVEQLNRLDDVLEGQRAAGQDMTREEIDVTITRILEA